MQSNARFRTASGHPSPGICVLLLLVTSLSAVAKEHSASDGLTLNSTRPLQFETDEGTWMSVDVHPNGDYLVFDLLGDIFTLSVDGGEARRLIGGMPFDSQPVYSPDGTRIAFTSDRSGSENLWIANVDGSGLRPITQDRGAEAFASPAWSADGSALYVSRRIHRREEFGLWMYYLDGGSGIRLEETGGATSDILDATASGDGRFLYYSSKSTAPATPYFVPDWIISRRDLRNGDSEPIVSTPGGAVRPVISPDGTKIAYGTRHDGRTGIRIRDLQDGTDRWLVFPVDEILEGAVPSRGVLPGFTFSSDGRWVFTSYGGGLHRVPVAGGAPRKIPFKAEVALEVGPSLLRNTPIDSGSVVVRLIQDPVQSPNGKRIAFSSLTDLYVVDLPDGEPLRLAQIRQPAFQPTWSPDGRWIAFVTWTAMNGGHVWKVRSDGRTPKRLTDTAAYYTDPVFSADGQQIFALKSSNRERMQLQEEVTPRRFSDLIRLPASGGVVSVIQHLQAGCQRPFVSAEPRRVYYTCSEGIVSVRRDGESGYNTDRRVHVRIEGLDPWTTPGKPVPIREGLLSPDGNWLLTRMANQLYLIATPPAADGVPKLDLQNLTHLPAAQVSREGADYYAWADGGRTMTWAVGSTFFRRALDTMEFSADVVSAGVPANGATERHPIRVAVERDEPEGELLLRGGTAITMAGGQVIADADVLVVNNRIAAIGPHGTIDLPVDVEVLNIEGQYLLPGFIDTHAHWYEIRHGLIDLQNWSFLINLAFGVTAGLDVQAMDQDMFAYKDLIDAGRMRGPRAFSVGQGMFSNNQVRSPEQVDLLLRRYRDHYRTPNVKSYLIGNRAQRHMIVNRSEALGVVPTTEGSNDLELDITHALDGFAGNEHALPAASIYDDVVRLYAETGIGYTPTLLASSAGPVPAKSFFLIQDPPHDNPKVVRFMPHFVRDLRSSPVQWVRHEEWNFPKIAAGAAKIMRAGGRIGVGSHAEFQGLGYHWELQALAAGGMTPAEVLEAATVHGSEIIGRAEDLGTLEPGKLADLLILAENPLDDIKNTTSLTHVMKNGRLYDADTLDELWPRQRPLPELWFAEGVSPASKQGAVQ